LYLHPISRCFSDSWLAIFVHFLLRVIDVWFDMLGNLSFWLVRPGYGPMTLLAYSASDLQTIVVLVLK
jgi:hypothetical protein